MRIREAKPRDARAVAKVQVDTWKSTYSDIVPDKVLNKMTYESRAKQWRSIISNQMVYVAEDEFGTIIGFANASEQRLSEYSDYEAELYAMYILDEYQRMGIGKQLLEPIVDELVRKEMHSMTVLVLEENESREFYESLGGKEIDRVEIELLDQKLNEIVYGWEDIREIELGH
ncbi:GNAT family N-acetyltransferase [Bacillus daqingensis]|uniref:GNAT family N-acetyltransferase n=1 Tax=Bacillus daqingensis TaxID=872396 RepID=A0ABV9NZ33_9BACI